MGRERRAGVTGGDGVTGRALPTLGLFGGVVRVGEGCLCELMSVSVVLSFSGHRHTDSPPFVLPGVGKVVGLRRRFWGVFRGCCCVVVAEIGGEAGAAGAPLWRPSGPSRTTACSAAASTVALVVRSYPAKTPWSSWLFVGALASVHAPELNCWAMKAAIWARDKDCLRVRSWSRQK